MAMHLPEPDIEYRLAHQLAGKENPLDRQILEGLVGGPRRYSELQPLLGKRGDHVLTKSLERLMKTGTIDQFLTANGARMERGYGLTSLGVLVVFKLHEMVPIHASIEAWKRGQALPA